MNEQDNTGKVLFYFGIMTTILLFLSLIFIILSSIKKEEKNYKYWVTIVGISFFLLLPIIGTLF